MTAHNPSVKRVLDHSLRAVTDRAYSWLAAFGVIIFLSLPAAAADLRIAAASDLNFAIKEIITQYERETGNHVQLTLGSSGTFFTQISEGAPFDIYLSADRTYP